MRTLRDVNVLIALLDAHQLHHEAAKRRIYDEGPEPDFADDTQAWHGQCDGSYERAARNPDHPAAARNLLLSKLAETGTGRTSAKRRRRARIG